MTSAVARAYNGGQGQSPQRGTGADTLWRMESAVWRRIKKQLVCQPASLSLLALAVQAVASCSSLSIKTSSGTGGVGCWKRSGLLVVECKL